MPIPSFDATRELLGKNVRVVLDKDDPQSIATGVLLAFDDGGGVVVLDEMGFKHYCWPMLDIVEV